MTGGDGRISVGGAQQGVGLGSTAVSGQQQ